ncbi:MAG: UvrD-helicase domain-containing protein [Planctomycetes bacterium]|nr:UvrD-helicase domain-containing protein [Planctomycetota bacterium]
MSSILEGLNEPQREAVSHGEGPLLVLAGAGSGKTRVITRRIAFLIEELVVPEWGILAITFTNKAAREMRERVKELLPGRGVWVATFHATCARILRREGERLGYDPQFTILDTYDRTQLLKQILKDKDLDPKHHTPAAIGAEISHCKNRGEAPAEGAERESLARPEKLFHELYAEYERRRRVAQSLDFDDLLLETVRLLETDGEVLDLYAGRFRHVLVDEYQDTNAIQLRLLRALASAHGNVCAVGDPDQSIYSWRGAEVRNILEFEKDFPGARTIKLEQNYRSSGNILAAATELIRRNRARFEKRLWTEAEDGAPVEVAESDTDLEEARMVARAIRRFQAQGIRPREIAIFYRANFMQRALEKTLREDAIPYQIVGGLEFFERKEIKDLVAYLALLSNPAADQAFLRVVNTPPRKLGERSVELLRLAALEREIPMAEMLGDLEAIADLKAASRKALEAFGALIEELRDGLDLSAADTLQRVIQRTGYREFISGLGDNLEDDRQENLEELLAYAAEFDKRNEGGVPAFLGEVALLSDVDAWDEQVEKVTLMTLHAAKGLEFDAAIIVGCEEGLLPHARSAEVPSALEEERRLMHVGMTRARKILVLSHARERFHYGGYVPSRPSRFLSEFESGRADGAWGARAVREFEEEVEPELGGFALGERVLHAHFGAGRVVAYRGQRPSTRIVVDFDRSGEKQLLLQYAQLRSAERGR